MHSAWYVAEAAFASRKDPGDDASKEDAFLNVCLEKEHTSLPGRSIIAEQKITHKADHFTLVGKKKDHVVCAFQHTDLSIAHFTFTLGTLYSLPWHPPVVGPAASSVLLGGTPLQVAKSPRPPGCEVSVSRNFTVYPGRFLFCHCSSNLSGCRFQAAMVHSPSGSPAFPAKTLSSVDLLSRFGENEPRVEIRIAAQPECGLYWKPHGKTCAAGRWWICVPMAFIGYTAHPLRKSGIR